MLVSTYIPLPLSLVTPPRSVVSQTHKVCKGAVLCIDFHPTKRNLVLCGSMDRTAFILDLFTKEEEEEEEQEGGVIVQSFTDHTKYSNF